MKRYIPIFGLLTFPAVFPAQAQFASDCDGNDGADFRSAFLFRSRGGYHSRGGFPTGVHHAHRGGGHNFAGTHSGEQRTDLHPGRISERDYQKRAQLQLRLRNMGPC